MEIPARAIRLLRVPLATWEWLGIESVAMWPVRVMMMWLPRCRAMVQPSFSNVLTTCLGFSSGTGGIRCEPLPDGWQR